MRAVAVDLDALDVLGVDVAGDVVAAVDDQDRLAGAPGDSEQPDAEADTAMEPSRAVARR